MYVWSKRLVIGLVMVFAVSIGVLWFMTGVPGDNQIQQSTASWITMNYILLMVWVFVWMFDQARVRGKNVWVWMVPFFIAPLPTLVAFVLMLQRRIR